MTAGHCVCDSLRTGFRVTMTDQSPTPNTTSSLFLPANSHLSFSRDLKTEDVLADQAASRINFIWLSVYQVVLRIGWIFKTESIIMPAFMDLIGGASWQLGCLPMLSRFGQSIPPLLFSDRIRNVRFKKLALWLSTMLMGSCFLVLSVCWWSTGGENRSWWPWLFLTVYALFFAATGVNQLLFSTLTGKLIVPHQRGRLAAVGSLVGGLSAIVFAFLLLQQWLESTPPKFVLIFGFTGAAMVCASIVACCFVETPDQQRSNLRSGIEIIANASTRVMEDRNFCLLAIAGAMFGMSMTLFPHYQSIARVKLGIGYRTMLYWIVAQHVGASLLAVPAGWLADQFGNRRVLRILMGLLCVAPAMLVVLQWFDAPSKVFYLVIFFLLGLTPITFRYFNNYTLEIATTENHPAYLSTLNCCMALPVILTSLVVGVLMDVLGFYAVFGGVLSLLLVGWAATFLLAEPRHQSFTRS